MSQRVLGTFLRWMQERPPGIFLVATSNDVEKLPPELLRRGRFDEIFFVDLPRSDERRAVFELHLRKRKRDPAAFDLEALIAASDGFSGAEIEGAIVGAMYRSYAAGTEPLRTCSRSSRRRRRCHGPGPRTSSRCACGRRARPHGSQPEQ